MKRLILILITIVSLTGCVYEDPHCGCDKGTLNLVFTYGGNVADFDLLVASDVELYLYDSEGKEYGREHISYEDIKGGKPYTLMQPNHTGNAYLIAWILTGGQDTDSIPLAFLDEGNYSTAKFTMNEPTLSYPPAQQLPMQELLWENRTFNPNLSNNTVLVDVKKLLCRISVTIEEGISFKDRYPGKLSMNIAGSSTSYHISADTQSGSWTVEENNFFYVESSDRYVSENGVLPASVNSESGIRNNIVVTLFEDGIARLQVDTETKAEKDSQIDVVIRPTKQEAVISVDSWQIRKALVAL